MNPATLSMVFWCVLNWVIISLAMFETITPKKSMVATIAPIPKINPKVIPSNTEAVFAEAPISVKTGAHSEKEIEIPMRKYPTVEMVLGCSFVLQQLSVFSNVL